MSADDDFPAPTEYQLRARELCDCETYCNQPFSDSVWHNNWSGCRAKRIHDALIMAAEESDRTWAYVANQLMRAAEGTDYEHEAEVHNEALTALLQEMERVDSGLPRAIVKAAQRTGLWRSGAKCRTPPCKARVAAGPYCQECLDADAAGVDRFAEPRRER